MNITSEENLVTYYNKFNEEKRLNSRHGQVEFVTSMKYIHECLDQIAKKRLADAWGKGGDSEEKKQVPLKLIDIGAGTGRYSIPLSEEGYDVTAVELVNHNLGRIKANGPKVKAFHGNAKKLKRFQDKQFDLAILFGPMYHLKSEEEKVQALKEALRVVKPGGMVLVAYIMNEFAVITHAFKDHNILESMKSDMLDESWHTTEKANELYSYVRLEDIDQINKKAGASRFKIISADGPANYMRQTLNAMNEEEFTLFIKYHLATCERMELMGAAEHLVDILVK